jgi:glycosidase
MIYYGDEAGMWGPDDPSNRQPMIWRDLQPYDDPQVAFKPDLFEHYQRLIALRAQKPALQTGSFRPVLVEDTRGVYAYVRELNGEAVYVVLNRAGAEQSVEISVDRDGSYINWADPATASLQSGDRPKLVAKDRRLNSSGKTLKLTVPAYGASILSMN